MKKILSIIGGIILTLLTSNALAFDVTLAWDASPSQDVNGYIIYWDSHSGTPKANSQTVGNVLEATIQGLADGVFTYFHVAATDFEGRESGPSNEVATDGIVTPDTGTDPIAPGGCFIKEVMP